MVDLSIAMLVYQRVVPNFSFRETEDWKLISYTEQFAT
jgi:hypothetical protein